MSGASISKVTLLFLAAHIPFALLIARSSVVATVHALVTLAVGLWWAKSGRRIERVAAVGAYITGAEVLWRMNSALIFWEFGKYAVAAIFLVALVRRGRCKFPGLVLLYFLLLLPSSLIVLANREWAEARQQVSFYLSGPFALTVCACFFLQTKLSAELLQRVLVALIAPVICIATVTLFGMVTATALNFGSTSNFATSGGYGPNQVSAILGLGALVSLLLTIDDKINVYLKVIFLLGTLFLAVQSAITFSRGGIYTALFGAALAFAFLIRDSRTRLKFMTVAAVLFLVANFIVLPRLDMFTGGALSARFRNLETTGRDTLFWADLQVWREHPVLGVGPGEADGYRKAIYGDLFKYGVAAHTEFSRLLSEHGIFGLAALMAVLLASVRRLRRHRSHKAKAVAAAMIGWALVFWLHMAMRLVAPCFTFGLAFAVLLLDERDIKHFLLKQRRGHVRALA
jgi:O-antigen ligase